MGGLRYQRARENCQAARFTIVRPLQSGRRRCLFFAQKASPRSPTGKRVSGRDVLPRIDAVTGTCSIWLLGSATVWWFKQEASPRAAVVGALLKQPLATSEAYRWRARGGFRLAIPIWELPRCFWLACCSRPIDYCRPIGAGGYCGRGAHDGHGASVSIGDCCCCCCCDSKCCLASNCCGIPRCTVESCGCWSRTNGATG